MTNVIFSVAFSRDNQSVFISDLDGNIKMIKWQTGANSWDDFDFSEEPKKVVNCLTDSICLTKDEKYLLVGSKESLCVFETETREVTKEFKLTTYVAGIILIEDYKKAIIAENHGDLSIIDLETMEMVSFAENITKGNHLMKLH